jgi:hypothetical protein
MDETVEVPQKDGSVKVVTKGEFLSSKLFQLAASGDLGAIKICLDNVDGPPTSGDKDAPLTVVIKNYAANQPS